jgi:hypothetical protein
MSGKYRAIIDGTVTTEFSIDEDALWLEKNNGHTELGNILATL